MGKKRKLGAKDDEYDPVPKHLVTSHIKKQEKRLIVILENAQLETVKNGNNFELLNCDDHAHILRKSNREPGSCRPDITHQSLLMLMDSPLNRAGLLQVYIHTEKNVLIEINPQTRIPRTFKRFAGLMVQLLHKFAIRASDGPMKLLKIIKNPVTSHLPVGVKKVTMSFSSKMVKNCRELAPKDEPIVLIIGAMAHGKVEADYSEDVISISNYPLSAALTCAKLCSAFEESTARGLLQYQPNLRMRIAAKRLAAAAAALLTDTADTMGLLINSGSVAAASVSHSGGGRGRRPQTALSSASNETGSLSPTTFTA